MINGITSIGGGGRIDGTRTQGARRPDAPAVGQPAEGEASVPSPAAELAASGPPVDAGKVARIRDAIAAGQYPVDAQAIAAKMIALDLPGRA